MKAAAGGTCVGALCLLFGLFAPFAAMLACMLAPFVFFFDSYSPKRLRTLLAFNTCCLAAHLLLVRATGRGHILSAAAIVGTGWLVGLLVGRAVVAAGKVP